MLKEQCIILTGAPGSGKSTLLQHLRKLGYTGIDEPARQILAEQRGIDGNGVPDRDPRLFIDLMLSRMIYEYDRVETPGPVFFDRGVPDMLGYAAIFGMDYPPGENAARKYRYNPRVFFLPAWEEIYATDDERTIDFAGTKIFGEELRAAYERCGYTLVDVPCAPVEDRATFILSACGL